TKVWRCADGYESPDCVDSTPADDILPDDQREGPRRGRRLEVRFCGYQVSAAKTLAAAGAAPAASCRTHRRLAAQVDSRLRPGRFWQDNLPRPVLRMAARAGHAGLLAVTGTQGPRS